MNTTKTLVIGLASSFSLFTKIIAVAQTPHAGDQAAFVAIGRSQSSAYPDEEAMITQASGAMIESAKKLCSNPIEIGPRESRWIKTVSWLIEMKSTFSCRSIDNLVGELSDEPDHVNFEAPHLKKWAHADSPSLVRTMESCDENLDWPTTYNKSLKDMYLEAYLCELNADGSQPVARLAGVEHRECGKRPYTAHWNWLWVCGLNGERQIKRS